MKNWIITTSCKPAHKLVDHFQFNKIKNSFLLASLLFSMVFSHAQQFKNDMMGDSAINNSRYKQLLKINQNKSSSAIAYVPIVVHVVYNSASQNLTDAEIIAGIQSLNKDFRRLNDDTINTPSLFLPDAAASKIEFCFANKDPDGNPTNGITRTYTDSASFPGSIGFFGYTNEFMKYDSTGGKDAWDPLRYINIWIADLSNGVGGFAYGSSSHGSKKNGPVIDSYQYRNGPRTITHELGHFFDLKHVFGSDGTCNTDDDLNDTPLQEINRGCPSFPKSSCGNTSDMFMNYMDYTSSNCQNMFSKDQVSLMMNSLNNFRSSLLSFDICSGIVGMPHDNTSELKFLLSPNPTSGEINIEFDNHLNGNVYVFNSQGNVVVSESAINAEHIVLNFSSNLQNGIYFLQIVTRKTSYSRKLVLRRN